MNDVKHPPSVIVSNNGDDGGMVKKKNKIYFGRTMMVLLYMTSETTDHYGEGSRSLAGNMLLLSHMENTCSFPVLRGTMDVARYSSNIFQIISV